MKKYLFGVIITKMSIHEAHCKLGHTAYAAVKHVILSGMITGIELDPLSKPEFCETCVKGKATCLPFPKESHTCAIQYGECGVGLAMSVMISIRQC